jgi:hypothetical protein
MAIRVNMLRLFAFSEAQPRTKKGQPAHSTTGAASAIWTKFEAWRPIGRIMPARWPPISRMKTGRVSARAIQKRRVMSASSAFGPWSAVTVAGSRAMPQIGQKPGPV